MLLNVNDVQKSIDVINAKIKQVVNKDNVLNIDIVGKDINLNDVIIIDNQKYRAISVELQGLNRNTCSIHAEHISYDLNVDMDILKNESEEDTSEYVLNGTYSLQEAVNICLSGTQFSLTSCDVGGVKQIQYSSMTKREAIIKLMEDFRCECIFDNYNLIISNNIGSDNGVTFKYAKNLTGLTKTESKDGTSYKIDIVELGLIDTSYQNIRLGDTITIKDETIGVDVKQRVMSIEYNPFRRIHTSIEIGNVEKDFGDTFINEIVNIEEKIENATKNIKIENIYNQITEVFKTQTLSADVIHSLNAWIDEMEVNYLRTNFNGRRENKGGFWNYIYIHDMIIEFNTAKLSAVEYEQYKTPSGKTIYWTAIADNKDAYSYFTLQKPHIPDKAMAHFRGEDKPRLVKESDFFVMVPKILEQYTKMQILFETHSNDGQVNYVPKMIWGAGDKQGKSIGKLYKDSNSMRMEYIRSKGGTSAIDLGENFVIEDGKNKYNVNLSDGADGMALIKSGNEIKFGKFKTDTNIKTNANIMFFDKKPTKRDIDDLEENTVVLVLDEPLEYIQSNKVVKRLYDIKILGVVKGTMVVDYI